MSVCVDHARIDLLESSHLGSGQTLIGIFVRLAREDRGIEAALPRVVENAVTNPVERIAGSDHCSANRRYFGWRDETGRSFREGLCIYDGAGEKIGPVIRGSPGDDSVVVGGIALSLHQSFAAA